MRVVAAARARLGDDGREPSVLVLCRRVRHRDLGRPLIDRLFHVRVVVARAGRLRDLRVQSRLLIRPVTLDDMLVDAGLVVPVRARLGDLAGQNHGRDVTDVQGTASLVLARRRVLDDHARTRARRGRERPAGPAIRPVLAVLARRDLDDLRLLRAVPLVAGALGAGVVELPTLNDEALGVQTFRVQIGRNALVGRQVRSSRADRARRRSNGVREQEDRESRKEQGCLSRHFASLGRSDQSRHPNSDRSDQKGLVHVKVPFGRKENGRFSVITCEAGARSTRAPRT
jgi:hypothetical protein